MRSLPKRILDPLVRYSSAEEGSALVEMAISASLFLAVIFGVIQASFALYTYNFVNEAAREATRYAIVRGSTYTGTNCTAPGYATCVAQGGTTGDIAQFVQQMPYPGLDMTKVVVTPSWPQSSGTATCPTAPCNNPGNLVQVKVVYPFSFSLPFMPRFTFNVASTSQLIISQ